MTLPPFEPRRSAEGGRVGRVAGVGQTTSQEFRVVLDGDRYLAVDDLVVVRTEVPEAGTVSTYGIVTESEATYEGATFDSDVHRIGDGGFQPAERVRSARVAVTRVDPEIWVAAGPGEVVERARGLDRQRALYVDTIDPQKRLAVGVGRDGDEIEIDLDYFDGTKGGHMSISGVSGVATKTTFAFFFLRMLTGLPNLDPRATANLRALVFNVKGEDLLWLDRPSTKFSEEDAATWQRLGVEPTSFRLATPSRDGRGGSRPRDLGAGSGPTVAYWAPPAKASRDAVLPDVSGRQEGIEAFYWTPEEFIKEGLLQFVFTDASDQRNQIPFVEERVRTQLQRWMQPVEGEPGAVTLVDPSGAVHSAQGEVIRDMDSLVTVLGMLLEPEGDDSDGHPHPAWAGRVQPGTISAFMRRLQSASSDLRLGRLVRAGVSRRIDRSAATVTVVAIQAMHDLAQRFVVGALLQETFREKELTGQSHPLSVVVLDELNKYAPREGASPLKEMLVDIAQRGRSLGVLLIGAQQSASRVAPDVLENASIRVAGRLDAAESERAEFGWMLPSTKARARLLKPGTMVLSQPAVPVPVVFSFPRVPWATRRDEVRPEGDPFKGL
ncbi:MAG: ATPase [Chloroflexi bacterium HGW-Chloroflexi-9]|nr:MAG: ATPase [Chloroflexi bacterium HGW-Chloroflexi-9]